MYRLNQPLQLLFIVLLLAACRRSNSDVARVQTAADPLPRLIVTEKFGTPDPISYFRISTDATEKSITLATDTTGGKFLKYYFDDQDRLVRIVRSDTFNVSHTTLLSRNASGSEITIRNENGSEGFITFSNLPGNQKRAWFRYQERIYHYATDYTIDARGLVIERSDTSDAGVPFTPVVTQSKYYYGTSGALDS
jgi:YD repeat-containing protein